MRDEREQIYLIFGTDEYLVSDKARKLVDKLCPPEEQTLGLEIAEATVSNASEALDAVRKCLGSLQTLGFFGGHKVVWLRDANFLSASGKVSISNALKDELVILKDLIAKGLPENVFLVISAGKLDKRSALYRSCKKNAAMKEFNIPEKSYQMEPQARKWASGCFKQEGLKIGQSALHAFVERTGTDSRMIKSEVTKLKLYLGDRREVSNDDIREIVSSTAESVGWDLIDAVGGRNMKDAIQILRQLSFQGESAIGLLIALENRMEDLSVFRDALDRKLLSLQRSGRRVNVNWSKGPKADEILSSLPKDPRKQHWFRNSILARQADGFSSAELRRRLKWLVETHTKIVSSSVPPDILLELLVVRLIGRLA